jgi:Transcription factor zinc-finger
MSDIERLKELRDAVPPAQTMGAIDEYQRFARAAHAALGPDGCVTRAIKAAEKENRILLARLVKLGAVCRTLDAAIALREVFNSDDEVVAFREVLNETPVLRPVAKSVTDLSQCPRCGETVPTTFRQGVLTYQCLKCAGDAL